MYVPNLYAEDQLEKYLERQKKHAWDLDKDICWDQGIDLTKHFVVLDDNAFLFPGADEHERLVISQYVGLLINSTICEMEKALERSKRVCWENMMNKYPTNPEMEKLGENFFVEEHKHSLAFERYLQMFADKVNVSYEELRDLLPVFNESKIEELFRVNSLAGGNAMWWVVAAVEEESIRVFQALSPYKKDLDPLFFDLHKKHFLEESRHAGYAFLMLELYKERAKSPINTVFKKMDFLFSEVMQITWMFGQLAKVRKIEALRHRHPFFETLSRLVPRLEQQRPWEIVETLFKDAPYISLILNPLKNKNLKKAKEAYNALSMKRPESWQEEIA